MHAIESIEELESLYNKAYPASLKKVRDRISPKYRQWIEQSRFVVLTTVGPEGTDGSPRGDDGPVVRVVDPDTLWLPDWRGNNRMDSLRNIVRDGRVSLMFMVPGSNNVVRINGTAVLTCDPTVVNEFEKQGKLPRSVIVINVDEIYFQCARALMRASLWQPDGQGGPVPSPGDFHKEQDSDFDADAYEAGFNDYVKNRMW